MLETRAISATQSASFSKPPLRFLTCGSVDDGKSTLIGRLLLDCSAVPVDQIAAIQQHSKPSSGVDASIDLALLLDGLEAERQQGITIDVAYRYFRTATRSFIIADTPGHEQYTRNMVTGASNCEAAVLVIDARKGLLPQTKRHSLICALLGIRDIVLAVNKLDLLDYSQGVFEEIDAAYQTFAKNLDFARLISIPLSALQGENVVRRLGKTPWYQGPTLLEYLETLDVRRDTQTVPFRMPVQWINRPNSEFRGFAGTIESGGVRSGDRISIASSGQASTVKRIVTFDGDLEHAEAGMAVTLTLNDEIDAARGDVFFRSEQQPPYVLDQFSAFVVWMNEHPLLPGRSYLMRIGNQFVPATVTSLRYKLDVNTQEHIAARQLELNEIAHCHLSTSTPVAFDRYGDNRETGGFILIDRMTNATAGAGLIEHPLSRAENLRRQFLSISRSERARLNAQRPAILWFTGLPGAGKSTIANLVEKGLHGRGHHTFLLDGDNVRLGLNRDLGFTEPDRVENIRRVGEVAKLFVDAGLIVLCAFISPFAAERKSIRGLVGMGEFVEIFVDASIETCVARDPKGLYRRAKSGEIKNFTGIDSPYEPPEAPELRLDTEQAMPQELADQVMIWLKEHQYLRAPDDKRI
jgi:bifunctional enzyme CysN/CysC